MLAPLLEREIAELTCSYCAGAGTLSTQTSRQFQGVLYHNPPTTQDCHRCGGSGIEPPAVKGCA
jgi:DnaJ-class molecular chaperone